MKRWYLSLGLAIVIGSSLLLAYGQTEKPQEKERVMRIENLKPSETRLFPKILGNKKIKSGGLYVFKPGETAHPEAHHSHDVDEVFIFVQGKGVLPIDGVEYPVKTGDVVIVKPGEDHHTRSSVNDPLVAAWYLMEK